MPGNSAPIPFIKEEPSDSNFDNRNFLSPSFSMSGQHNHQFGSWQGMSGHIDPSELNMASHSLQPTFGSSQNLSSSFIAGNALIGDDELLDLVNNDIGGQNNMQQSHQLQNNYLQNQDYSSSLFSDMQNSYQQNSYSNHIFSNTPEGAPIQSPFMNSFNYGQWGPVQQQRSNLGPQRTHSSAMAIGSFDISRNRPSLSAAAERTSSDSRSPMTPRTPAIAGLRLGTPDPTSLAGRPIRTNSSSRSHQKNVSAQWEGTPGSALSYMETPLSSPGTFMNPAISGLMQGSMPKKVEHSGSSKPGSSLEAKRQKRRESHNAVERRRRNNINDRIQELSRLVPQHRLDDDALRKAIGNGTATAGAPTGSGMSPPRRTTGGITQGLPMDDKDKGPAKGDVLNGAVSWTRDLMWYLRVKLEQEAALMETIESLGGQVPYQITDAEQRMRTEFLESLKRNDSSSFDYTRFDGSGLWVPGHTDQAGQRVTDKSHAHTVEGAFDDAQFWGYTNEGNCRGSLDLKEEDDYGMELN